MSGNSRRPRSGRDHKEESRLSTRISGRSASREKERYARHHRPKSSDVEADNALKSRDFPEGPNREPSPERAGRKEARRDSFDISRNRTEQRNHTHSPEETWDRSHSRSRGRGRSTSPSRGRSRSMSPSRGRERKGRYGQRRSRSISTSPSRVREREGRYGQRRSRSPLNDYNRREPPHRLTDRRSGFEATPPAEACRSFKAGTCRMGSRCKYLHSDNSGPRYAGRSERDQPEGWEGREGRGGSDYSLERQPPPQNAPPPCKYFLMGSCVRDNCRFSHDAPIHKDREVEPRNNDRRDHDYGDKKRTWNGPTWAEAEKKGRNSDVKDGGWNGPKWGDIAAGLDVKRTTGWGDSGVKNIDATEPVVAKRGNDGEVHDRLDVKDRGWNGPSWGDMAVGPDVRRTTGWGDSAVKNTDATEAVTAKRGNEVHDGLGVKDRGWNGPTWDDMAIGPDVRKTTGWGDSVKNTDATEAETAKRRNDGEVHDRLSVKDRGWNGPTWGDVAVGPAVRKTTGWGDSGVKNKDATGPVTAKRGNDGEVHDRLGVKDRGWNGPTWGDVGVGPAVRKTTGWGDRGVKNIEATEPVTAKRGNDGEVHDRLGVKDRGWNGPTWGDVAVGPAVRKPTGWGDNGVKNKDATEPVTAKRGNDSKVHNSLDVKDRGWNGPTWADVAVGPAVRRTTGWGDSGVKSRDATAPVTAKRGNNAEVHDRLDVKDRGWNGPTWADVAVGPAVRRTTGWGDSGAENIDATVPVTAKRGNDGEVHDRLDVKDRGWNRPAWGDVAVGSDVRKAVGWGTSGFEKVNATEQMIAKREIDGEFSTDSVFPENKMDGNISMACDFDSVSGGDFCADGVQISPMPREKLNQISNISGLPPQLVVGNGQDHLVNINTNGPVEKNLSVLEVQNSIDTLSGAPLINFSIPEKNDNKPVQMSLTDTSLSEQLPQLYAVLNPPKPMEPMRSIPDPTAIYQKGNGAGIEPKEVDIASSGGTANTNGMSSQPIAVKSNQKPENNVATDEKVGDGPDNANVGKDEIAMRLFKNSLVEVVKDILNPTWKEGWMGKDVFKAIVKKVVDKVTSASQGVNLPNTQANINQYLEGERPKFAKLVEAYAERYKTPRTLNAAISCLAN